MGNTSQCCIFGSRRPNRVHPLDSRLLGADHESTDVVSFFSTNERPIEEAGLTPCSAVCVIPENELDEMLGAESPITEFYNEAERGNEVSASEVDNDMVEWLAKIEIRNASLPSYMAFNNKRHLLMRLRFTEVMQRMNYTNTIQESSEDETGRTLEHPKNTVFMAKTTFSYYPKRWDRELLKLTVNKTPAKPVRVGQNSTENSILGRLHGADQSSFATSLVNRTLASSRGIISGLSGGDTGILSIDSNGRGGNFPQNRRKFSSQHPARHFQISSNWLDEDFNDNILAAPNPSKRHENPEPTEGSSHVSGVSIKSASKLEDMNEELCIKDRLQEDSLQYPVPEDSSGLFFSTVTRHSITSRSQWFSNVFKRRNRTSSSYNT